MAPTNMKAIETITLSGGTASYIEFANIPQTYTDLYIKASLRGTSAGTLFIRPNNDTGTNMYNAGAYFTSGSQDAFVNSANYAHGGEFEYNTLTANTFSTHEIYFSNYTRSVNHPISMQSAQAGNTGGVYVFMVQSLWSYAVPITSIRLVPNVGSWAQYSSVTLYGITSTGTDAYATGGYITSDNNYYYHTFASSGTFTPKQNLTCDYLVVAGGGGGGNGNGGGGGGAGGVLGLTAQSLTTTTYAVTIGGGGAVSTDGTNSSFASSTALKGGRGGDASNNGTGGSGTYGSGGGCGRDGGTLGGAGTSGQGFAGGNSAYPTGVANGGSGGGGAGGAGNNVISTDNENRLSPNGDGGVGTNAYASWLSAVGAGVDGYLAGGGGGSAYQDTRNPAGGLGGGGRGTMSQFGALGATAGVVNTGSGGGGGGTGAFKSAGQPGGSGLVIIRYAK